MGSGSEPYIPKIRDKKASTLTLKDLGLLFDSWILSYDYLPLGLKENPSVHDAVEYFLKDYMGEVIGEFFRYRLADEDEAISMLEEVTGVSYFWAFSCFAIGVECALGNIKQYRIPFYCAACSKPLQVYLVGPLDILLERSKFKEKQARKMASKIISYISNADIALSRRGLIYSKS